LLNKGYVVGIRERQLMLRASFTVLYSSRN